MSLLTHGVLVWLNQCPSISGPVRIPLLFHFQHLVGVSTGMLDGLVTKGLRDFPGAISEAKAYICAESFSMSIESLVLLLLIALQSHPLQ